MYDHNVFAVLTAHDQKNKASSAFKLPLNSRWFREAVGGVAEEPTINSREATPAEDPRSNDDGSSVLNRLLVTFNELMKNPLNAIQAGTNPTSSHILLGYRGTKGISARQYNIVVNDDLWIWLHDSYSAHGTAVGYDGQNQKEVRRKETWILAYAPGTRNQFGEMTIHSGSLAVKIQFPGHEAADPRYVDNLREFVEKCKEAAKKHKEDVPGVEGLGLESEPTTQAPSEALTPRERLIYYRDKRIGKGAFGEVHRIVKSRDGKYFAAKTFNPLANKNKRKLDEIDPAWLIDIRREFTIMSENPHESMPWTCRFDSDANP
jgi:hypothetical protein